MSALATAVRPAAAPRAGLVPGSWAAADEGGAGFGWRAVPGAPLADVAAEAALRLAASVVPVAAIESVEPSGVGSPDVASGRSGTGRATLLRIGPSRVLVAVELAGAGGGRQRFLVTLWRRG